MNEMVNPIALYITPAGDDCACGSEKSPLYSLSAALDLAASAQADREVVIYIAPGKYFADRPVNIDEKRFSHLASLKICGAGMEQTQISGTIPITPEWEPYRDGIYVAQLEKGLAVDGLVCAGEQQIMARYPNYQENVVLNGYSEDAISPERVAGWKNPAGGYIRALHHAEWGGNSFIITGKTPDNQLLYQWVGDNNRGSEMHAVKRMVENIFEELDVPKEWYYNKETGALYFYPEREEDLAKDFELIVNPEIIRMTGSDIKHPVCGITIEGIRFTDTARTLFTGKYERILRGDWGIVRAGVLYLENAERVTVRNCRFDRIGGNAVTMSGYNSGHTVDYNEFTGIGATGVLVTGLVEAVRNPSEYDNDCHKTTIGDFEIGPKTEDFPRDIVISNNYFYDIGVYEKQTAAVCLSISRDVTVRRNTVHHTSRAGLNINNGTFGGHLIEDNDIFDCVTETADHGALNTWGRDRYWSVPQHDAMGYYGREKRAFAELDAYKTTVVRHNRVTANHAFGLDFDDGTSNYDIYNNLCVGVGIKLRDGFDRRVHNNLLIGSGFELHMTFEQNQDLIYSNVVFFNKAYNLLCVSPKATTIYTHNLYWNAGEPVSGLPEEDFESKIADPCFYDLESNDFRLRADSPALQMGFVNFPMSDEDFGRPDKPKPQRFIYTPVKSTDQTYRYYDVILSNIEGEGIRSAAGLPNYDGAYIVGRDVLGLFCVLGLPVGIGDVIVQVGDTLIKNAEQFIQVFGNLPEGQFTDVIVYRSQKPKTLSFMSKKVPMGGIAEEATKQWLENQPEL